MKQTIGFKLNGKKVTVAINGDESLLTVLREYLDNTGTKYSCGLGQCGACTVILNNQTSQSCITYVDAFENAKSMLLHAFDNGITHFDLANNYGPPAGSAAPRAVHEKWGRPWSVSPKVK